MIENFILVYNLIDSKTRRRMPLAFFVMLFLSALEVVGISLVFPLIQSIFSGKAAIDFDRFKILSILSIDLNHHLAFIMSFLVFGLFILKNILSIFLIRWQVKFLAEADHNLSIYLMKKYMAMSYVDYLSSNSVDMARNIMNVVSSACSGFLGSMLVIATEFSVIFGVVFMLLLFSPLEIISIGFFMIAMSWGFQLYFKEKILKSGEVYLEATTKSWKEIVQTFLLMKDLRILGREKNVFNRFAYLRSELCEVEMVQKFTQLLPRYFLEIIFSLSAFIFCVFLFKIQIKDTASHLALLGVVGVSFVRLIPSVNKILSTLQVVRANAPAVLALQDKIGSSYAECSIENDHGESFEMKLDEKGLILKDVNYRYPTRTSPALQHINLSIHWGESVGLVGESGSGKSTLIDVILGFLVPDMGEVYLGAQPISSCLKNWRKIIGYVPQNIYLCDDTVLHNIGLGLSDDEIDEVALNQAIKLSNVSSFIEKLPEGLNTLVGEQGVQLSGGQKQCIGIARALYHDPSVLILDEATSSLDNESEHRISSTLEKLYRKKTLIIVAHRLSTVRYCDKIVFMEHGCISGIGTFDELKETHLGFKRLVELGTL